MERVVDARGLKCPMPLVKAKKELDAIAAGDTVRVLATDKGSVLDFQGWARQNPAIRLLAQSEEQDEQGRQVYVHVLARA
jgi:TusA-related sulfurtransferase